jgi:tRNA-splicing ligase RtcB
LEVQVVDQILDPVVADAFGLNQGQVCVMIHSGSRGLGHQICTDHVRRMEVAMDRHGIEVPDPQLACAPVRSPEGEAYLGAMAAAANYGRANRQLLSMAVRAAFARAVGTDRLGLHYDVSHNLAKLEVHEVDGEDRTLCVHRKGATRALPPRHPDLPVDLAAVGQPVLVPGSMGTASYVLVGEAGAVAFHSTCHGAGRTMSRSAEADIRSGPSAPARGCRHRGPGAARAVDSPRRRRSRTRMLTPSSPRWNTRGWRGEWLVWSRSAS